MGNHRADRRSNAPSRALPAATSYASAGKRSAGRRKAAPAARKPIPAIPTVVGAVALTVAGAGVLGLGGGASDSNLHLAAGAANIQQTVNGGPQASERSRAISRDSDRQALQDAADQALKQVAEKQSRQRNGVLAKLAKNAEVRASEIEKNQWVLPVEGYHLTARFGMGGGLWARDHTGLDFAAPINSPIRSVANGVVTETGYDGSYGNKTVITLEDGTEIWYCHQNSIGVSVGETVIAGQQIGLLGSTGNSTGPHMHLEVRPGGGDPVDPFPALIYHGLNP